MSDQALSGSSFSGAKSTGDQTQDAVRADEMVSKVLKVLVDQEDGKMTEPVDIDKGVLSYFCKKCQAFDAIPADFDIENNYTSFACPKCDAKEIPAIGFAESLKSNFRLK